MAKKQTRKKTAARGRGKQLKGSPAVSGLWRVSIIVYAIVFFRALELFDIRSLEFLRTVMDAYGNTEYNLNFAMAAISAAGFVMLMLSKPGKTLLTGISGAMALVPVWLMCEANSYGSGAAALSLPEFNPLNLLFSLSAALWCMCMVRGGNTRTKLITAAVLIAENAALCLMDNFPIDWFELVRIDVFAIFLGLAVDFAYNGFSPATLIPAAAICAELMMWYWDKSNDVTFMITVALCGAGLVCFAAVPKLRKDCAGFAATLAGIAVNALSILYLNGLLF